MAKVITLKQIYYDKNQISLLEQGAVPFLNDGKAPAAEREFGVMKSCYLGKQLFQGVDDYEGFISWKFSEKARIPLTNFISACQDHQGFDVYILNPFPHQVLYKNVWHHGESHHPGLLEMGQRLVNQAGLSWDLSESENRICNISYCNFWVGNKKFWDLYMGYGQRIYDVLMKDPQLRTIFFKPAPGGNVDAPYFAFFFERLITEILNHHPEIKVKALRYPMDWLKQNYRADVADFLGSISSNCEFGLFEKPDIKEKAHFYFNEMQNAADFYSGHYFGSTVLKFIKRQTILKKLLRNSWTLFIYRSHLKKMSDLRGGSSSFQLL